MFTVYDGIYAYAKSAITAFYNQCVTAIFNDPNNQYLTVKGKETMIRQVDAGYAGDYNKQNGWMKDIAYGNGVEWVPYWAGQDRGKILRVDAVDEEQSFAAGMTPSIQILNDNFLNQYLCPEIDTYSIARFASQVPEQNHMLNTESGFQTDPDNILQTINNLDNLVFNSGYGGPNRMTVLFMRPGIYSNFITAIQNKNGLANDALAEKTYDIGVPTGFNELFTDGEPVISMPLSFRRYLNFLIVRVPDDRMFTSVMSLSGDLDDPLQAVGGIKPDYSDADFAEVQLLAVPLEAGFVNVKWLIDQLLVPATLYGQSTRQADLQKLNQRMLGNIQIGFAGINQKANAFEYDIRAIYGASLLDIRKKNCFVVTGPVGAQSTPVETVSVVGRGGTSAVRLGDELAMRATVLPANATNKGVTWSVEDGTGKATIRVDGVLVPTQAGEVTVKATSQGTPAVSGEFKVTIVEA